MWVLQEGVSVQYGNSFVLCLVTGEVHMSRLLVAVQTFSLHVLQLQDIVGPLHCTIRGLGL